MSDKEKIKAAVSKLRRKDPRVIAIRNMIALAKAKGTPGDTGKDGLDGMRGADGINGINGIDGLRGADGLHGAKGLDGSKGEIGAVGPQGDKGEAGMIWRGTYRSDLEYWIGDVVGVSGSAYVCVAATNQAPPVGFGWELLVSRGAQGVRGIKGEAGSGAAIDLPVSIANGGTGQTTQKGALDALLPDQAGNADKLLKTNGISASWTVLAAPASTLSGATLASNVLASSLTSTGTLAALTVTATIAGSINGNAATATTATTAGTVTTAAQPAITSVGTLTALTVNGTLTLGTTALISSPSATALAIKSQVPAGTGVTPTIQIICPSADFALQNVATTQAVFNTPVDTISLQAATTYMFEGQYLLQTGTTSHTTTISFVSSGAATPPSIAYTTLASAHSSANATAFGQQTSFFVNIAGGIVATASVLPNTIISFKGIIRATDAGNLVPNILFSVAPGVGANFTLIGSYISFYPLGANTIDSVGTAIS